MSAVRVLLWSSGVLMAGYGAALLSTNSPEVLVQIAIWAGAGVLLHDFVLAPVCAALGWAGGRLLPPAVRMPVGIAGLCLVVLGLLAVPVYDKPGRRGDNSTVLDRDYHLGLQVVAGAVALVLLCHLMLTRLLPVRQDHVVEQQRTDHVEGQPPAV